MYGVTSGSGFSEAILGGREVFVHVFSDMMLKHSCQEFVLYIEEGNGSISCGIRCISGTFEDVDDDCAFPFFRDGAGVPQ